ncbi:TSUP family transporter [Microvirga thermotolerans]|uniref:Probable membrane transporter protein n=1 Tax=Microvirga thermotolerans TaxID=2651334 RepID=A0A5P9K1B2_9HYPH|nr:TSUP family transporter [Microvirga thermotolerans]QFU18221.1 TSUP family transporter [Microvirga thermotolerans]
MAALAAVSLVAGFVDSIAGGGGLVTVPALLLAGLDPAQAIATNKVQGTFAAASATYTFGRKGLIAWASAWRFALVAFASGIAGALCVRFLPRPVLDGLIPVLLIAIALFFAFSPSVRNEDAHARMGALAFGATVPVAVGFYDGIFGPGAGSFYMLAFVTLLGYGVVRATAHTKLLNLCSNLGSLFLYAATGAVVWPVGLLMAGASLLGAQIGSRLAMRHGARIIRPLLVAVSGLMALRLLLDPANPWRQGLAALF